MIFSLISDILPTSLYTPVNYQTPTNSYNLHDALLTSTCIFLIVLDSQSIIILCLSK